MTNYSRVKRNKFWAIYGCLLSVLMILLLSGCGSSDPTYSISGRITSAGSALAGVTVTLSGDASMMVTTDADGNYTFRDVPGGTYTITPSLAGSPFRPLFRTAWLSGIDGTGFDFVVHDLGRLAMSTHTTYVKDDGSVWAWGNNSDGQLGDGSVTSRSTPVQVSGLSGIRSVAAGSSHTAALKSDGTVWTWGNNSNGQLGDGSTTLRNTPVQAGGLSGVTAVVAGSDHTVALKNDGTVWAWGNNSNGQLGDGSTTLRNTPAPISGLSSMTAIAAGSGHTVALKSDGTVWAWGNNINGQLGDGSTTQRNTPVQVSGLSSVTMTAIAAGSGHTVVLKNDGTVWAWGNNTNGQLGDGSTTQRNAPVQVSGLSSVTMMTGIAAGFGHTVALRSDGTVWTWGKNSKGQLGNGLTTDSAIPVQASTWGVTDIAAGYEGSVVLKGVLRGDGTVWAWGSNSNGQLGNGLTVDSATPVRTSLP
jgi:alpha-tubulin suppressor-like RCC1 family protein